MITETWLREDRVDLYPIDGYNQFAICRKSRGGGLLMYVHRSIEVSLVPSLTKISNACESLFVKFNINNASHYAGVVYRSPNRPIADFISAFDKLCISLPKNDCIIGGDFNINLLDKVSYSGVHFITGMSNHNLKPMIPNPTRVTHSSETLIDHIWSSMNNEFQSFVITEPVSDHFPTLLI